MTACSPSSEADETVVPAAVTTTTSTVPESQCRAVAERAALLLQGFVDDYDTLSIAEWNALDPPPDLVDIRDQVVALAQSAVDLGCDPSTMEAMLIASVSELSGEGPVGSALAAAFRGDDPIFGPPAPVATTNPREVEPSTVTVQPGQDLDAVLERIAPGSTVEFAAGTHHFTESIVVDIDVTFVGAGRENTIISSSAEGVAVVFVGPGGFEARDLTVEHTGDAPASVLMALEGPVRLQDAAIRGAVVGTGDAGGGHGVVFAFEQMEGLPERSAAERSGELTVQGSIIADNQAGGILMTGDAAPNIDGVTISGSGSCGLCFTGTSSGTVLNSVFDDNAIGIQIGDDATPMLNDSTVTNSTATGIAIDGRSAPNIAGFLIDANQVGVQIGGESAPVLNDSTVSNSAMVGVVMLGTSTPRINSNLIEYNGDVGVQAGDSSNPVIEDNNINHHGVGVLVAQSATPSLMRNGIANHDIGIQIGGEANAEVIGNTVWVSAVTAISIADSSTAVVDDNSIADAPGAAIQAVGDSSSEITGNTIESAGSVGISFTGNAVGTAADNEVSDRVIGVQVAGSAAPDITDNTISSSVDVGIRFAEAAKGRATGNVVSGAEAVGVLVEGTAAPEVRDNELTGNGVGLAFTANSSGTATFNTIQLNTIGVQVVGQSEAFLSGNLITDNVDSGAVFGGTAVARFELNTVVRNGDVAVQVTESAAPVLSGNELRGPGVHGIIYRDSAAGVASGNRVIEHAYGIQVQGSAAPDLVDNTFEEILLTSIVYISSSGGSATGNSCPTSLGAGIVVSDVANPTLDDNDCTVSSVDAV